jgi:hypothetical protein
MLEWIQAAHWSNHTIETFFELDGDKQSFIVASYRAVHQIDAVMSNEQVKKNKRKGK